MTSIPKPKSKRNLRQKKLILDKSAGLFYRKGYRSTSMRDIANVCHFEPANIYYYFSSKEQILYEVYKEATFSGAHRLLEYGGKCESLHGHNWRVRVYAGAEELDRLGMVIDFKVLGEAVGKVVGKVDHRYLNEVAPFDEVNPSAENIARFVYDEVSADIDDGRVRVTRVMVWESDASCAIYRPPS